MSEAVVESLVSQPPQEEAPVAPEPPAIAEVAPEPVAPEPKKRGRPQGAKDTTKRVRKPAVKLRIEPIVKEAPAETPTPVTEPPRPAPKAQVTETPREPPTPVYEPSSPRTLFRLYNQSLAQERHQRKQDQAQKYISNWSRWPL